MTKTNRLLANSFAASLLINVSVVSFLGYSRLTQSHSAAAAPADATVATAPLRFGVIHLPAPTPEPPRASPPRRTGSPTTLSEALARGVTVESGDNTPAREGKSLRTRQKKGAKGRRAASPTLVAMASSRQSSQDASNTSGAGKPSDAAGLSGVGGRGTERGAATAGGADDAKGDAAEPAQVGATGAARGALSKKGGRDDGSHAPGGAPVLSAPSATVAARANGGGASGRGGVKAKENADGGEEAIALAEKTPPGEAVAGASVMPKVAKMWSVPPGQKIVLPDNLKLVMPKELPVLTSVTPLTPEQLARLRKLLQGQNLQQMKGLTREQLKKMLAARKDAEQALPPPDLAAAPPPAPTKKREATKKQERKPRPISGAPREQVASLPQGLASPFRYRPWNVAWHQRYAPLVQSAPAIPKTMDAGAGRPVAATAPSAGASAAGDARKPGDGATAGGTAANGAGKDNVAAGGTIGSGSPGAAGAAAKTPAQSSVAGSGGATDGTVTGAGKTPAAGGNAASANGRDGAKGTAAGGAGQPGGGDGGQTAAGAGQNVGTGTSGSGQNGRGGGKSAAGSSAGSKNGTTAGNGTAAGGSDGKNNGGGTAAGSGSGANAGGAGTANGAGKNGGKGAPGESGGTAGGGGASDAKTGQSGAGSGTAAGNGAGGGMLGAGQAGKDGGGAAAAAGSGGSGGGTGTAAGGNGGGTAAGGTAGSDGGAGGNGAGGSGGSSSGEAVDGGGLMDNSEGIAGEVSDMSGDANGMDTGFVAAPGVSPNYPEHNHDAQKGLPGALVLPPLPPAGTAAGRAPKPRPAKTVRRAERAAPRGETVAALPAKPSPSRAAQAFAPPPVRASVAERPLAVVVGSASRRGTVSLLAAPPVLAPAVRQRDDERAALAVRPDGKATKLRRATTGSLGEASLAQAALRGNPLRVASVRGVTQQRQETKETKAHNSEGIKAGSQTPIPPTPLPDSDAELGDGSGLKGEYFLGRNFEQYQFSRADANLDLFWGADRSPSPRLPAGADWSCRWTGKVAPRYSETYTFYAVADDGVRVWINHKLIIDDWTLHPLLEYSGTVTLQAGHQYDIRVDYFESGGPPASVGVYWESAHQKKEFIPEECFFYPLAGSKAELEKDEKPRF